MAESNSPGVASGKASLISYRDFRKKFSDAYTSVHNEPFEAPEIKSYVHLPSIARAVRHSAPGTLRVPDSLRATISPHSPKSTSKTPRSGATTTRCLNSPHQKAVDRNREIREWFEGEERPRKLQLTMEDVLAILTMFARSFPLHPELNRVSEEDIVLGIAELTSLEFAHMIRSVCIFLHMSVMLNFHPHANMGTTKAQEEYELMVLEIYEGYVELQSKLKRKKAHLMFIYPLLLLSLRVAVETVFRNAYPAWFNSPIGNFLMATLNYVISSIFDPDHYSNASSFLCSYDTSISLKSQPRLGARPIRKPLTSRFYTTSSLVQSVCAQPTNPSTRVFVGAGKPHHDPLLPSSLKEDTLRSLPAKRVLYKVALAKVRETSRNNVSIKHHLKTGEELFQKS